MIADELEEEQSLIEEMVQVASAYAPEYELEKVCEAWDSYQIKN